MIYVFNPFNAAGAAAATAAAAANAAGLAAVADLGERTAVAEPTRGGGCYLYLFVTNKEDTNMRT